MINFRSSDSCRRIDRIARAFYRSGTTGAVTLDVSKAFDRVWHAALLHKVKRYGITGQVRSLVFFLLFSVIEGVPQGTTLHSWFVLGLCCSLFLVYTFPTIHQ